MAVAAVKVRMSVGEPKVLSTLDCTLTVIVGLLVPATDRTCNVAYRYCVADTAASCTAVPEPVAVRAVPGGFSTTPRDTGQEPPAVVIQGATSPTVLPSLYDACMALMSHTRSPAAMVAPAVALFPTV